MGSNTTNIKIAQKNYIDLHVNTPKIERFNAVMTNLVGHVATPFFCHEHMIGVKGRTTKNYHTCLFDDTAASALACILRPSSQANGPVATASTANISKHSVGVRMDRMLGMDGWMDRQTDRQIDI